MIELIQHGVSINTLASFYTKLDEISLHISKEIAQRDVDRLKDMSKNTTNKYDASNIKHLINYINKIIKSTDENSTFEICWNIKDGLPNTYPFNLINEKAYGIDICNYIELSKEQNIVEVDLSVLSDIIAFEFMYKDLDESHESMEELLKDCGIIGVQKASLLTQFFKKKDIEPYIFSKTDRIGETPYYSVEDKKVNDYFLTKQFNKDNYKDVVEYSCKYANTLIMNQYLKNAGRKNIDLKPIMISATNIAFIIENNSNNENNEIKQTILEDISIRSFGRRFLVEPTVQIF